MKKIEKKAILLALVILLFATGCSASTQSNEAVPAGAQEEVRTDNNSGTSASSIVTSVSDINLAEQFTERDLAGTYDGKNATAIDLNSYAEGEDVIITAEGVYIFSGALTNGQIVVEAGDTEKVQMVLNNVTMVNDDNACILVKKADKVFVTLAEGSENFLSDTGDAYAQNVDGSTVDGVVFSKEDIVFNGAGTLTIEANYENGIVGKDDLKITGGTYHISAAGKGIQANDSIRVYDGTIEIDAADDAIHTDNDEKTGKGYIYICGGTISIRTNDDAIHAATALLITNGDIRIEESYEGLEADTIDLTGGSIEIMASDDGINAAISLASDNVGFEAGGGPRMMAQNGAPADGETLERPDGMTPPTDHEMPEPPDGMTPPEDGEMPTPPDGMTPPKDGEKPERSDEMMRPGGAMFDSEPEAYIRITGGTVHVNAAGDGIDSNGWIYIEGGNTIVEGPTNNGNGAIDFGVGAKINAGTLVASGSSGMAEGFTDGTQCSVKYIFENNVESGMEVKVTDEGGREVLSYISEKEFSALVFSVPELKNGTYTITAGSMTDTITIADTITSAGKM